MRRASLTSVIASLCAAALVAAPAAASPAGMAGSRPSASASMSSSASVPAYPTGESSWWPKTNWSSWSPGSWKFWGKDKAPEQPLWQQQANVNTEFPSKNISPFRHPIQYMSATVMETPIARKMNQDSIGPQPRQDSIALNRPIGDPTAADMIAIAQVAERQGNVENARAQFRMALSKWPNDVEVLRATARLEDRQGRMDVAESLYRRAVATDPQHAAAYNDLGLCLARTGRLEQSAQALEQAICLQPDKALYRNNAALVLVEMRQEQKALAHLSAVHTPAASNYNLGQLLVTRGRTPQAVPYFQAAIEQDPAMDAARVALAQATGMPVPPAQVAEQVPLAPGSETPSYGPQFVPQQSAQQPAFPATARGPAWDASSATARSAVPVAQAQLPVVQAPAAMIPMSSPVVAQQPAPAYPATAQGAPVYQTATAPRYLPPVQSGTMVR